MSVAADPLVAVAGAVPGVRAAARVVATDGDHVLRVRLESGADAAEVGVVVGRLLAAAEDLPAPSLLTGPRTTAVPRARHGIRPRIVRVDLHTDGPAFTAMVELACARRTAEGTARTALTTSGTRRAVATATLQAVEGLLAYPVHLELEHVERSETANDPVVLVHLSLVSEEGVQRLTGSAIVREDESGAVVRAALDAVNRRVETLVDAVG